MLCCFNIIKAIEINYSENEILDWSIPAAPLACRSTSTCKLLINVVTVSCWTLLNYSEKERWEAFDNHQYILVNSSLLTFSLMLVRWNNKPFLNQVTLTIMRLLSLGSVLALRRDILLQGSSFVPQQTCGSMACHQASSLVILPTINSESTHINLQGNFTMNINFFTGDRSTCWFNYMNIQLGHLYMYPGEVLSSYDKRISYWWPLLRPIASPCSRYSDKLKPLATIEDLVILEELHIYTI